MVLEQSQKPREKLLSMEKSLVARGCGGNRQVSVKILNFGLSIQQKRPLQVIWLPGHNQSSGAVIFFDGMKLSRTSDSSRHLNSALFLF